MKAFSLLLLVSLTTFVTAFSDPGAYERLWFWYAYTLDNSGTRIAQGCAKAPKRCTFVQFMNYIDQNNPRPKGTLKPEKLAKVDPSNVERTIAALKDGLYTGPYHLNLIHAGVKDRTEASAKVFQAVKGFVEGKVQGADQKLKDNLRTVTLAIYKLRQSAAIPKLTDLLRDNHRITLVASDQPIWDGATEPEEKYPAIDFARSAAASGVTEDQVKEAYAIEQEADPGHTNNIRLASDAAQSVSKDCIG